MAIFENALLFSDKQAVTATAMSTKWIETDGVQQIGRGEPVSAIIHVTTAADATDTNETYTFAIITDDNTAFSSPRELVRMTVPAAELKTGSVHFLTVPKTNEKYIRLNYVLAGTTPSITVTSYLGLQSASGSGFDQFYPSGYTV